MTPLNPVNILVGLFVATAILANTGLLWRIALKVGNMEGKMTFVKDKIEQHNNLVQRVTVLEVKETIRGSRRTNRRVVEPDDRSPAD